MGGWSDLPVDLVRIIEDKLLVYKDKVTFRIICSSWRSALPNKMPHQNRNLLPWLLVPFESKSGTSFGFFDPLENKVHPLSFPQGKGMLFRGSSHGWVVNIEKNSSICLINPLTGAQVQLPPRHKFPDVKNYRPDKPGEEYLMRIEKKGRGYYPLSETHVINHFIKKVVLSSSPQSKDFVAVAIYGEFRSLAYCKLGDKKWSFLGLGCYSDILFHEGQMYVLGGNGRLMVCDIHHPSPKLVKLVPPHDVTCCLNLVESSTGLFMIERNTSAELMDASKRICSYKTHAFFVYKLDKSGRYWFQVNGIGDDMFFVGWNSSLSMSTRSFPEYANYIPGYVSNCIYFTDDHSLFHKEGIVGGSDMGVFSLTYGSIRKFPCNSGSSDSKSLVWPPPVWFMPKPF